MNVNGQSFESSKVEVLIEEVTPERAEQWLARNTHNRALKRNIVRRLAGAIARDEWEMNAETIKFDLNGNLIDGQHRLAAVILAGKSIQSAVVRGLPSSVQQTVDLNDKLRVRDVLKMRGETEPTTTASALSWLYRHQNERMTSTDVPTVRQALKLLENSPELRLAARPGKRLHAALRVPAGLGAYMYHVLSKIDSQDAEDFFDRLIEGQAVEYTDHPINTLRRTLENDASSDRKMPKARMAAFIVKAWNAYREGRSLSRLRWVPGGANPEEFPEAV